eukprot:3399078-Prorocentrum_lima.AAC.1
MACRLGTSQDAVPLFAPGVNLVWQRVPPRPCFAAHGRWLFSTPSDEPLMLHILFRGWHTLFNQRVIALTHKCVCESV